MGGRKRGGCFFSWIRSDLPDEESPVVLLAAGPRLSEPPGSRPAPPGLLQRWRQTLSLDHRRPRSMHVTPNTPKQAKQKTYRPKSFFSLETFLDSRRSDGSSADDYSSSKYCKFYLESAESSPLFKGRTTPDLLDTPGISSPKESRCKKRLDKLENHFNRIQNLKRETNDERNFNEPIYSEPVYCSQSTLVVGRDSEDRGLDNAALDYCEIEDRTNAGFQKDSSCSAISIEGRNRIRGTRSETPSSYEILVRENDAHMSERTKELIVKIMDKSVDSIGSCSLDVDAETTDFSDTTSGSLNLLTPSSHASRHFTSRLHERAAPAPAPAPAPSYLGLACSAGGYSSHTAYQRPVWPTRPLAAMDPVLAHFKTSYSETSITNNGVTNGEVRTVTQTSKSFHVIGNGKADTGPSKSFIQQRVERLYGPGALAQGFFNQQRQKTKSQCESEQSNGFSKSPESIRQISRLHHVVAKSPNGASVESSFSSENGNGSYDAIDAALPVLRHLRPEFRAQLPILSPKRSFPSKSIADCGSPESRIIGVDVVDRAVRNGELNRITSATSPSNGFKSPKVTIVPIIREETPAEVVTNGSKTNIDMTNLSISNKDRVLKNGDLNGFKEVKIEDVQALDSNSNRVCEEVADIPLPEVCLPTAVCLPVAVDLVVEEVRPAAAEGSASLDGHYFLELKRKETERLIQLAETAERDLEELQKGELEVSEEVQGFLRSAAGKARLLATQKMQQFEGLCHNNLNRRPSEPFPTTCEDLQGFWDMVCLQLSQVTSIFQQLEHLRMHSWKLSELPHENEVGESAPKPTRSISKPKKTPVVVDTTKQTEAARRRSEQRKSMMEARRKMAAQTAQASDSGAVEIFASPLPNSSS